MTYRARNCRPVRRRRQAGQLGTSCSHDCNQGRACNCRSQSAIALDGLSLTRLVLLAYALIALTYFFAS